MSWKTIKHRKKPTTASEEERRRARARLDARQRGELERAERVSISPDFTRVRFMYSDGVVRTEAFGLKEMV